MWGWPASGPGIAQVRNRRSSHISFEACPAVLWRIWHVLVHGGVPNSAGGLAIPQRNACQSCSPVLPYAVCPSTPIHTSALASKTPIDTNLANIGPS